MGELPASAAALAASIAAVGAQIHANQRTAVLFEAAVASGEARVATGGALAATTGVHTGRSPKDKYILKDEATRPTITLGPDFFVATTGGFSGPVEVLSAYRSPTTNAWLASVSRGVASDSQHMNGNAMDISKSPDDELAHRPPNPTKRLVMGQGGSPRIKARRGPTLGSSDQGALDQDLPNQRSARSTRFKACSRPSRADASAIADSSSAWSISAGTSSSIVNR